MKFNYIFTGKEGFVMNIGNNELVTVWMNFWINKECKQKQKKELSPCFL